MSKAKAKKPIDKEHAATQRWLKSLKPHQLAKIKALAECAYLTLGSRGKIGVGSGMVYNHTTEEAQRWELDFFNALDGIGYRIDRDAYYADIEKKTKRRIER